MVLLPNRFLIGYRAPIKQILAMRVRVRNKGKATNVLSSDRFRPSDRRRRDVLYLAMPMKSDLALSSNLGEHFSCGTGTVL